MHTTISLHRAILLISLLTLSTHAIRNTPTSFCKCICGSNSTIIPLNASDPNNYPNRSALKPRHNDLDDIRRPFLPLESSTASDTLTSENNDSPSPSSSSQLETSTSTPPIPGSDTNSKLETTNTSIRKYTCQDCTRTFCQSHASSRSICADTPDPEIFTTCFQRDSLKDESVVFIFLVAVTGLLGWAVVKPWVDQVRERGLGGMMGKAAAGAGTPAGRSTEVRNAAGVNGYNGPDTGAGTRVGGRYTRLEDDGVDGPVGRAAGSTSRGGAG